MDNYVIPTEVEGSAFPCASAFGHIFYGSAMIRHHSDNEQGNAVPTRRAVGVILLGFLFMFSAFPLFFHLISKEIDSPSWRAVIYCLAIEVTGIGLVTFAWWSRIAAIIVSLLAAFYTAWSYLFDTLNEIHKQSGELGVKVYTPAVLMTALLIGLALTIFTLIITYYLTRRGVKEAFSRRRDR